MKIKLLILLLLLSTISQAQWAGGLIITSNIEGATIKINGVKKGTTPCRIILKPGTYTITARKDIDARQMWYYKGKVTVTNGKIDDLALTLEVADNPNFAKEQQAIDYKVKSSRQYGYIIDKRDGIKYKTVKIGKQWWMAENLRATKYPDGTPIPYITSNSEWANLRDNNTDDAYCYYNNNTNSEYGCLYTYAAAIADNWEHDNKEGQGVCPDGWHLPDSTDWQELVDYLGGSSVAGGRLKESGTTHWDNPNTGATNVSGFTALPGGTRYYNDGSFSGSGYDGYWWSASGDSGSYAWRRYLNFGNAVIGRYGYGKSDGFSVRCVRDN